MLEGSKLDKQHIRMPIWAPTGTLLTAQGPYADLVEAGQAARGEDLPLVSVVAGFPYGDTPYDGLTVLAYGTGERPGRVARDLARRAWDGRERFRPRLTRSEEHTSELQSLMRISYAGFCLKKKKITSRRNHLPQNTIKQTT